MKNNILLIIFSISLLSGFNISYTKCDCKNNCNKEMLKELSEQIYVKVKSSINTKKSNLENKITTISSQEISVVSDLELFGVRYSTNGECKKAMIDSEISGELYKDKANEYVLIIDKNIDKFLSTTIDSIKKKYYNLIVDNYNIFEKYNSVSLYMNKTPNTPKHTMHYIKDKYNAFKLFSKLPIPQTRSNSILIKPIKEF